MRTIFLLSLLASSATALAEVPTTMSHQGRLFDNLGVPLDGPNDVTMRVYDDPSTGTMLWEETFTGLEFDNGYFQVQLGGTTALDGTVFDGSTRYLAIEVGTTGELPTRLAMVSVPYAVRAGEADSADTAATADSATTAGSADALASGVDIDVNSVRINGTTVIDSSGAIDAGALGGATLGSLICSADEIAVFDGSDWQCSGHDHDAGDIITGTMSVDRLPMGTGSGAVAWGDHTHAAPAWGEITGIPADIADGDDDTDTQLSEGQVETFVTNGALDLDGGTTLGGATISTGAHTTSLAWTDITGIPADIADGDDDTDTDTQLSEGQVETFVTNGSIDLDPASTVGGEAIMTSGSGVIRFLASTYQNGTVEGAGQVWRDVPGTSINFTVPTGVTTTRFRAHGSVHVRGGGNNNSHCGFRFVVDGAGLGNGSWGDVITGCAESGNANSPSGWWCPWTAEREASLAGGAHTLKLQQTGWSGSVNNCYSEGSDYSRANVFVEAY